VVEQEEEDLGKGEAREDCNVAQVSYGEVVVEQDYTEGEEEHGQAVGRHQGQGFGVAGAEEEYDYAWKEEVDGNEGAGEQCGVGEAPLEHLAGVLSHCMALGNHREHNRVYRRGEEEDYLAEHAGGGVQAGLAGGEEALGEHHIEVGGHREAEHRQHHWQRVGVEGGEVEASAAAALPEVGCDEKKGDEQRHKRAYGNARESAGNAVAQGDKGDACGELEEGAGNVEHSQGREAL